MTDDTTPPQQQGNTNNDNASSSNQAAQAPTNQQRGEVFRVGIKPPVFCKEQPDLYFIQMESQFAVAGITVDQTKYHHVISSLEGQYLIHVADIVRNPPATEKYNAVKNALINEFADSGRKKLRKLIKEIELGDLKPSQLLKRMKDLANGKMDDDAVKSLWIERLTENIRSVITIVDGDSAAMALQADKMIEMQNFSSVSSVSKSPLAAEIQELRKQIELLKMSNSRKQNQNQG